MNPGAQFAQGQDSSFSFLASPVEGRLWDWEVGQGRAAWAVHINALLGYSWPQQTSSQGILCEDCPNDSSLLNFQGVRS